MLNIRKVIFCVLSVSSMNYAWSDEGEENLFSSLQTQEQTFSTECPVQNTSFLPYRIDSLRVGIGYAAGQFIGIRHNYGEFGLFLPIRRELSLVLLDVKGYRFENSRWGFSAGFGTRVPLSCRHELGFNVFYDYLESCFRHSDSLDRMGLGFEWLNSCWQFRLNFYLPLRDSAHSKKEHYHYKGGFAATCKEREFAYNRGFDAEIGLPFCWRPFQFYAAMGPYYYSHHKFHSFWGGYARFNLAWKGILNFQIRTSYDRTYHSQVQGMIQLSIPLGQYCCCFEDFPIPIYRNGVIFTRECCDFHWNW